MLKLPQCGKNTSGGEDALRQFKTLKNQPIVSTALVVVNILVFVLGTFYSGEIFDMGMLKPYHILERKEYGRILWAVFLHGDVNHLLSNMFILFFLGAMIEKEVGHVRYAILYFLSGIGGNLFSLIIKIATNDISASLGASGAIFGLDGVLLAMVLFSGRKMENVTPIRVLLMIVCSLYSGLRGANIDNAAHIGGLVTGFVSAAVMCVFKRFQRKWQTGSI